MLVVGTLTVEEGVALDDPQFLGLPDLFLHHHLLPLLDCDAALSFLNASNIHKYGTSIPYSTLHDGGLCTIEGKVFTIL